MPNKQEQYTKLASTKFTNTNVLSKPDLKSIGNKVLNAYASTLGLQLTDDTDYNYWTTPPSEMHRIKYFKYSLLMFNLIKLIKLFKTIGFS